MNVIECGRCRKTLIDEEFSSHVCTPLVSGTKELIVEFAISRIDENGDHIITASGLDDGLIYRLVECKHNPTHRVNPRLKPRNPTTFDTKKNPTESGQNRSGTMPIYRI